MIPATAQRRRFVPGFAALAAIASLLALPETATASSRQVLGDRLVPVIEVEPEPHGRIEVEPGPRGRIEVVPGPRGQADVATRRSGPDARLTLARRYEHGEGLEQDYAMARELYCALAHEGSATAAYHLGWMYLNGRGVERDDNMAATWLGIAAEGGHNPSRNLLKTLSHADQSVERDCPQDRWQTQSAEALEELAPDEVESLAKRWALEYALDPYLVLAVIAVESDFKARAVSHKSAMGLMQLIPETAARFGVKNVFDPSENIRAGSEYLRWLLDHFEGDLKLALAGYNAGENKVVAYAGVPPYRETLGYIEKIRALYAHPDLEPNGTATSPAYPRSTELARVSFTSGDYLRSDWGAVKGSEAPQGALR